MDEMSHYSLGPSHCCHLLAYMDMQRKERNEALCDIRFVMGNDYVYAHRSVLAVCSAYFQGMLSGAFLESQGEGGTNSKMMEVDLSGCLSTGHDLDVLLSAIYTGSLTLSPSNVKGVMELSCFLLVESVREVCEQFLLESLSLDTCLSSLILAHHHDLAQLFRACRKLLHSRFHDYFIHQPDMLLTPTPCLRLLTDIYRYVPLHDVLQFLVHWVDASRDNVGEGGCVEEEKERRLGAACDMVSSVVASLEKCQGTQVHTVWQDRLVGSADILRQLVSCTGPWVQQVQSQQRKVDSPSTAPNSYRRPGCSADEGVESSPKDTSDGQLSAVKNGVGRCGGTETSSGTCCSTCTPGEDGRCQQGCADKVVTVRDGAGVGGVSDVGDNSDTDKDNLSDGADNSNMEKEDVIVSESANVQKETVTGGSDNRKDSADSSQCACQPVASSGSGRDPGDSTCSHCCLAEISIGHMCDGESNHCLLSPTTSAFCASKRNDSSTETERPDSIPMARVCENIQCHGHRPTTNRKRPALDMLHLAGDDQKYRKFRDPDEDLDLTDVVVAFVPDQKAVKYFTATDCEKNRPRYCPVDFQVCVYDVGRRRWLWAGSARFPDKLEERDSWRVACVNCRAYFVSVGRRMVHVLDLRTMTWSGLDCQPLLHIPSSTSKVRSLVPIAVGNRLYVLASNKQPMDDGSESFVTLQQYFLLEENGRWKPVVTITHTHMATPLTLFNVSDHKVYVVKATIALNLEKSMLLIQEGHVLDCDKGEARRFVGTTYSAPPLRLLVRDGQVHTVDGNSCHQQLQLNQDSWHALGYVNLTDIKMGRASSAECHLPCLTHSFTVMGSSVWEFATFPMHRSALTELHLDHQSRVFTVRHPPPPFYYVTFTTASQLSQQFVSCLEPCRYLHADRVN